jgi:hypothetical protein
VAPLKDRGSIDTVNAVQRALRFAKIGHGTLRFEAEAGAGYQMTKRQCQIKLETTNPKSQTPRPCSCHTFWDFGFGICHSFVIGILQFGIAKPIYK